MKLYLDAFSVLIFISTCTMAQMELSQVPAQVSAAQRQMAINPQGAGSGLSQVNRLGLSQSPQQTVVMSSAGNAQAVPADRASVLQANPGALSSVLTQTQVAGQDTSSLNGGLPQGLGSRSQLVAPKDQSQASLSTVEKQLPLSNVDKSVIGIPQVPGSGVVAPLSNANQASGIAQQSFSQTATSQDPASSQKSALGLGMEMKIAQPDGSSKNIDSGMEIKVAQAPIESVQQHPLMSASSVQIPGVPLQQPLLSKDASNPAAVSGGSLGIQPNSAISLDSRNQIIGGGGSTLQGSSITSQGAVTGQQRSEDTPLAQVSGNINQFLEERSVAFQNAPATDMSLSGESEALQRAISTVLLDKTAVSAEQANDTITTGTDGEDSETNGVLGSFFNWFGSDDSDDVDSGAETPIPGEDGGNFNNQVDMSAVEGSALSQGGTGGESESSALVEDVVDQDLVNRNKPPTGPSSMVLFYTWMIVTIMVVVITISTCQHRLKGVRIPFFRSRPHTREEKRRLAQDYA